VADVLNLLSLLDNPLQDVPLLAVLRSPFAGLSLDQLALIRLAASGRFWVALQQFHRLLDARKKGPSQVKANDLPSLLIDSQHPLSKTLENPALREVATAAWERVDSFLRQYRDWRRLARQSSLSACLERILTESQYFTLLLAQSRGQQLQGNLRKLMTWVRQFDQFQRQSLFRFLQFVDAQKKADIDREPALLETENAVRLMSIHQSKGLEFGIVVVADLGKAFNFSDLRADIILDERYGLCPLVKAPFSQQRYPSLPYWLAQKRQRLETLGEELRLLYVGMTRACQSLILLGTASQAATKRWSERVSQAPGVRELAAAKNALDWIGPWFSATTGRPDWFSQAKGETALLSWTVYHENEQPEESSPPLVSALANVEASPDEYASELPGVLARATWQYPNEIATLRRAKISVSALRKEILARNDEESSRAPRRRRNANAHGPQLSAAEVGVAHHTFLQFASLDELAQAVDLDSVADRLEQEHVLSAEERKALDLESIASFWRSPVGIDLLKHRDSLRRELPFTARLSLTELHEFEASEAVTKLGAPDFADDEFIILTGVVDLAVILPEALWILDFKTDSIGSTDADEMVREYQPQLRLYARALSRIYDRPVQHCWLHSLPLRRTFDFKLPL
jgi:ATP-dependent helicase/nuclease subunit A